jgi:hypothetical protein
MEEHKKEKATTSAAGPTEGVPTGVAVRQQAPHCTEHVDEEFKLYCETCSDVICYKCIMRGSKHHSHDYESIDDAFEKYKEEISAYFEPMGKQLARIDQALTGIEACSAEVTVQQDSLETSIEEAVMELHKELETRKTKLLDRVQVVSRGKQKSLAAQKDQIETTQAQLHSCQRFLRNSTKTERQGEVLKMKKTITDEAKEMTRKLPPSFLKTCVEPDIMFSAPSELLSTLQHYGAVFTAKNSVNPANCRALGTGLDTAVVGKKSTAIVQLVNWNGSPYLESSRSLECELESMLTGTRVKGKVEKRECGLYEISYKPVIRGRSLLHVRVKELDIQGSPFSLEVLPTSQYQVGTWLKDL